MNESPSVLIHRGNVRETIIALCRSLSAGKGGVRAYDLFALTVATMILGHFSFYFMANELWLRVPDRIMAPVFLVSVGYNSGRPFSRMLCGAALLMTFINWAFIHRIYFDILAVIIVLRFIIDPLMTWSLKSRVRFWSMNLILLLLTPVTINNVAFGNLGVIMAIAGWINRNRSEVPASVVKPYKYFVYSYFVFFLYLYLDITFDFSILQFVTVAAGLAWIMYLLYNFRQLLLNSISARPRDAIERLCSFMGHKSLEVYVISSIAFQILRFVSR
jgi:hypothetical protein